MEPRRNASRRPVLWVLLAVGLAMGLLVVLHVAGSPGPGLGDSSEAEDRVESANRHVARSEESTRVGPTLAGTTTGPRVAHGPVTVSVRDQGGVPLPEVEVEVFDLEVGQDVDAREVRIGGVRTDASGRATFADLPYDGSLTAMVRRVEGDPQRSSPGGGFYFLTTLPRQGGADPDAPPESVATYMPDPTFAPPGSSWRATAAVLGPEVTLVLDRGLPLRLEVREGGRGRVRRETRFDVWPVWTRESPTTDPVTLALHAGDDATVRCRVRAPDGWLTPVEEAWVLQIHPLAQRLQATVPLRPEARIVVIVPEECRPFRTEDCALTITVAGFLLQRPVIEPEGPGRLGVRGAVFFPGDQVEVSGSIGEAWHVTGTAELGEEPRARVAVALRAESSRPKQDAVVITEIARVRWMGKAFRLDQHANIELTPVTFIALEPKTSLLLKIVDWRGAPAAHARVTWGAQTLVADASGRVRFPAVTVGQSEVRVVGAGAAFKHLVDVAEGRPEQVLTAPSGGTLDVEVVDDEGEGLAYPRIVLARADGLPQLEVMDGVQRIDPYGDAEGRRTFRFVSSGTLDVHATFGSRRATVTVLVSEGTHETVRTVLPRVRPEPAPEVETK
jgi:hypothetical protein